MKLTMKDKRLIKKVEKSRELKVEIIKFAKSKNIDLGKMKIDLKVVNKREDGKIFVVIVIIRDQNEEIHKLPVTMKDNLGKVIILSRDINSFVKTVVKLD